jgi:DNA-directed RNA polymerase specialized sigma24 family protein
MRNAYFGDSDHPDPLQFIGIVKKMKIRHQDAETVCMEAFLNYWRHYQTAPPRLRAPLLIRCIKNQARQFLRRLRSERKALACYLEEKSLRGGCDISVSDHQEVLNRVKESDRLDVHMLVENVVHGTSIRDLAVKYKKGSSTIHRNLQEAIHSLNH